MFVSSLLGGILGILFLIPFRKYFVNDKHGEYPFPKQQPVLKYLSRVKKRQSGKTTFICRADWWAL